MGKDQERPIDRLIRWAEGAGMNQVELANQLGVEPGHVTNWKTRGLPTDRWVAVADLFGRSIDELAGRIPETSDQGTVIQFARKLEYSVQRIPVVGTAHLSQDGYWKGIQQHPDGTGDGYINMHSSDRSAYAIRIVGETTQSRVRTGEYAVIEPNHALVVGEEVLIITKDGRSMVRDYLYQRDGYLAVQNNKGERQTFPDAEIDKVLYVAGIAKSALHVAD